MKPIAPGTVIFHRHRGYGVLTTVNLLTGWVAARFGSESHTLDLNLSTDGVQHADGEPILFRRTPPERMPHARLMAMVRALHAAGYQRLYLYSWPKPSGLHWRWQLFTGPRHWMQRPWREGWYGSGADYNVNPVMQWGDAPGASSTGLIHALAQFDPVAQALGRDEDHTEWFAAVCAALLPHYAYSLGSSAPDQHAGQLSQLSELNQLSESLPVFAVRQRMHDYAGSALPWPPGWSRLWGPNALSGQHHLRAVVRHDIIPASMNLPLG
ncbi:hypothetical protein BH11PSE12_BH11PSE12_29330 [soil metagenome]